MINPHLTAAIAAFHAANAAIPHEALDNVMDAATGKAGRALDLVCRIPAFAIEEADAKLTLADGLVEWDALKERLVEKAQGEMATIHWNQEHRAA